VWGPEHCGLEKIENDWESTVSSHEVKVYALHWLKDGTAQLLWAVAGCNENVLLQCGSLKVPKLDAQRARTSFKKKTQLIN